MCFFFFNLKRFLISGSASTFFVRLDEIGKDFLNIARLGLGLDLGSVLTIIEGFFIKNFTLPIFPNTRHSNVKEPFQLYSYIYIYIYIRYDQSVYSSCFALWELISTAQIKRRSWRTRVLKLLLELWALHIACGYPSWSTLYILSSFFLSYSFGFFFLLVTYLFLSSFSSVKSKSKID